VSSSLVKVSAISLPPERTRRAVVVPTQFVLDSDEVILHLVGKNPILEAIEEQPGF